MKKDQYYFDVLVRCAGYGCEAARFLQEILRDFDPDKVEENMDAMHAIEHNADDLKHEMISKLSREFVTPIEREDILALSQELDNVVDCVDDVMQRLYIYNVLVMRNDMDEFTDLLVRCTESLHRAAQEFAHFKKSQTIKNYIVEVNSLESDGDSLYVQAMRKLNITETNPIQVMTWAHIYEGMENCLDACEHASDVIESVIMKNS